MEEGKLGPWLKATGDCVRTGERIFTLEGEKAAEEIESFESGILCIPGDAPKPGDTVRVGQIIGFLLADGEAAPHSVGAIAPTGPAAGATSPPAVAALPRSAGPASRRLARQLGIDLDAVVSPDPTGRIVCEDVRRSVGEPGRPFATPRARRRAKELNVDWTRLSGSGRGGRIRERDVIAPEPTPAAPGRYYPATKLRRVIAQRMVAGVSQAAPVTLTTKIDAGLLVADREHRKRRGDGAPIPSYNDILLGLVAKTLREQSELNACWYRDGIYRFDDVNLAMAVDTDAGLLAPVIHSADRLTFDQIAERTRELIAAARDGRLTPKDLEGGTFTVTNLGMFGIDAFTPVLNLPQAGILGIGRILQEPVVRSDRIEIGWVLTLSLTFDHRVLDGAAAARWLQSLCGRIRSLEAHPDS
jgi:pyruvate dehydrogenase E2 component (dihydrolipoamide acetyltransferase)